MSINEAERKQDEFNVVLNLYVHTPLETKNILRQKNELLENPKNFCKGREKIIEASKNEIFPLFKKDDIKLIPVNQQKDILDKPE